MTRETRRADLRQMLETRRSELKHQIQARLHDVRENGRCDGEERRLDSAEVPASDLQQDIDFALIEMQAETLRRIEDALARLDRGEYGRCIECGDDISQRRLAAVPFAPRCRPCEAVREQAGRRRPVAVGGLGDSHPFGALWRE